ncbi:MAG: carboxypeptidase regulatory-like domain-containing protein [Acidobacteria bacterium]|nr:carboxypeptidase regulatory-like domain-containing protein [Acidobacteriota bacterium]
MGRVLDATGGPVAGAKVAVRQLETNIKTETTTNDDGQFRALQLPIGNFEVTVEKEGFAKYIRPAVQLALNQRAELQVKLQVASVRDAVTVVAESPIINTTNAEISTNFDAKRVSELPLSTNRNILNLAASVPGISVISSGNNGFGAQGNQGTESTSTAFSANGNRLRSNAFLIDGQDSYYGSTGGLLQGLNNPDIIGEVRIITNQFLPEFGRAAGSVVNIVTKGGTNQFHGSGFWFYNGNKLNARSNLDKAAGFTDAPFRIEHQYGGTFGGPVIKDKTFFFGSLQRWTTRVLGSGSTINGAPTEEGRRALESIAAGRPAVRALLDNLPAGVANGQSRMITADGRTIIVPLGNITGAAAGKFDDWQYSGRVDHRFNQKHSLMGRFMVDDSTAGGQGQATPAGLTTVTPLGSKSAIATFTSTLRPTVLNEFRASYNRYESSANAENPAVAERIPSIEIPDLGLRQFNASTSRTGIGLAANYPQATIVNGYQIQDSLSVIRNSHSMKFGFDFRRQEQFGSFLPQLRGRLEYANLQALADDRATAAQINALLPGALSTLRYRYYDFFFFAQDEWRLRPNFTITYGIRYEAPGNPFQNLADQNQRVLALNNNNPAYAYGPVPKRDLNNWAPRFGFNYRFGQAPGMLGWLTGDGKLVLRGGYSRTYDTMYLNIPLNIGSSFPFVFAYDIPVDPSLPGSVRPNAFNAINNIRNGQVPPLSNPNLLIRTITSPDFRAPLSEQVSLQFQRELGGGYAASIGYVGTKGTGLFQSIDGNAPVLEQNGRRVDPNRGVIRERCNCTSSTYHSLQTSLEKRLSRNFSFATHYTWSSFIDGASEVFNPSARGEIAFPQDPTNRNLDRARSTYDRPHRFTTNGVFELPFRRGQSGLLGRVTGGWQVSGFLTFQGGAPFTVLNGVDPRGRTTGNVVGTPTRPDLNTGLNLSSMTVREVQAAGGAALFRAITAAHPTGVGNAGRNILRADGINRLDLGVIKNIRVREGRTLQFHANFFNLTNTRDWGIPDAVYSSPSFLLEGPTDGGNRRVMLGLRFVF